MSTDWSKLWEVYFYDGAKEIPIAEYRRQQSYEKLSAPAKHLLGWLGSRKKKSTAITLVELCKCLSPTTMRKAAVIRLLMAELVTEGFAEVVVSPVYYSGAWRCESWNVSIKKLGSGAE